MNRLLFTDTAGNRTAVDVTHVSHLRGYQDGFAIRDGLQGQVMLQKYAFYKDIPDIHALADYLASAGQSLRVVPMRRYQSMNVYDCDYIAPRDVLALQTTEVTYGQHCVRMIIRGGSEIETCLTPDETDDLIASVLAAKPAMMSLEPHEATISRWPEHLALYLDPAAITQVFADSLQVRLGYQGHNALPACHPPQYSTATQAQRQAAINALAARIHAATSGLIIVPGSETFTALRPADIEKCTPQDSTSAVTGAPLHLLYISQTSLPVFRLYPEDIHLIFPTAQARDHALQTLKAATAKPPHPKP